MITKKKVWDLGLTVVRIGISWMDLPGGNEGLQNQQNIGTVAVGMDSFARIRLSSNLYSMGCLSYQIKVCYCTLHRIHCDINFTFVLLSYVSSSKHKIQQSNAWSILVPILNPFPYLAFLGIAGVPWYLQRTVHSVLIKIIGRRCNCLHIEQRTI